MKFYATIALFSFALVAVLLSTSTAKNSTWGWVAPYDRLLYRGPVVRKSELFRVVTYDFSYPRSQYEYNPYTISAVKAIDHQRKNGGYALLNRGGPGYRNVTLHIKSERSHGFNFTIEVWTSGR